MSLLSIHQRLETSGARGAEPFSLADGLWLGVPQLAADLPGTPAHMNGGNSDVDALLFKWRDNRFELAETLPSHGGEDVEPFRIGDTMFLAVANLRAGAGPYELNVASKIYRRGETGWEIFQEIDTFAAKQWRHFTIGERHFLALAQGLTLPHLNATHPRTSRIYEWDGTRFVLFQELDGGWGYNFTYFETGGGAFLAYADHTSESLIYCWNGERFIRFQTIAEKSGRAFTHFRRDGADYLAFASIDGLSVLYRWDGGDFAVHQQLDGTGGREFAVLEHAGGFYLVRINFIEGLPSAPKTDLRSHLYRWESDKLSLVESFPTFGGTDAHFFTADNAVFLVVSNSLTAKVRFRTDTIVYRLNL